MKQIYIFLFLFIGNVLFINAQDLIVLKDGTIIEAKVLEITPAIINYKDIDNLEGPAVVISSKDVLSVRYENGKTEVIEIKPSKDDKKNSLPVRDASFRHWVSGEIGILSAGLSYEYVFTPRFSLSFGSYYNFLSFNFNNPFDNPRYINIPYIRQYNTGAYLAPRWYPVKKFFFMDIGLGYNFYSITYGLSIKYNDTLNFHSLIILPGIGWSIDVGKPGGFYVTPGIKYGLSIDKDYSINYSLSIHGLRHIIYCYYGLGYSL